MPLRQLIVQVPPPPPPIYRNGACDTGLDPITVERIADGDTWGLVSPRIATAIDRVRLAGINAPEKGEPWWSESREALADLLRARSVRLEPLVPGPLTRGRCNRIIAWVWCDGVLAQWALCLRGLAEVRTDWGVGTHTAACRQAEEWAREAGLPRWHPH